MPISKRPMREYPRNVKELGKLIRSLEVQVSDEELELTDADIPSTIARDSEVATAIAVAMTAHVSAGDPHPTYINAAELAAALALLNLASGVYTPTLTSVANTDLITPFQCVYARNGNVVTVSGIVLIDPTAAADTQVGMSLPIASNLAALEDLSGAGAAASAQWAVAIYADAANNRAEFRFVAPDTTGRNVYFTFQYRVIA